ncbi:hypothetical protein FHG87_009407 [Trinorchestia longiramus]|nr:hypothetical protein FHG87_009407 [Trinorchestia longiramus]
MQLHRAIFIVLLSSSEFDDDARDISLVLSDRVIACPSRPGRPPKRPHEILNYGLGAQGVVHGALPPHGLSPEALMALKKTRMDGVGPPFLNGAPPNPHKGEPLDKSPLLSNGYNPPPKAFMAQYMALNGGALPHPALLAHGGLPLPPHPAAPWTQPLQQPHGPPEMSYKAGPHPEAIARSLACRASYDEVLKQLDRFREDQNRSDRILGLDRDERENLDRETPSKANGYGESDVLNLSSKSDSREDLSDAGLGSTRGGNMDDGGRDSAETGGATNGRGRPSSAPSPLREVNTKYSNNLTNFSAYNHHSLMGRHQQAQHADDEHEKDEALSDNDDFDDKNDTSDHDDFEYNERSFKSPLNNNNNNNNNQSTNNNNINGTGPPTSNGGLLGTLVGGSSGGSSNSSTSSNSILSRAPGASDRLDDRLNPLGLPLGGALMGLGLGAGADGVTGALPHSGGGVSGGAGAVGAAGGDAGVGLTGPPLSSLENLLGNIQNLLKVATESVRHEERQKEQLRTEFLRQKDIKERLEKQLLEDEKQKELYQKRLKRERRARRRLEEELTEKLKRLSQYEPGVKELLKSSETMSQESRNAAVAAAVAAVVSASGCLTATSPSLSTGGGQNGSGNSAGVGSNGLLNGGAENSNVNNGGPSAAVAAAAAAAAVMAAASGGSSLGVGGILTSTAGGGCPNSMGLHLPPTSVSSPKKEPHRLSPKSSPELDVRPPAVSSTEAAASLFFSKSMLFNCTA